MVLPWEIKNYDGPFTVALRGDDECVVIDFSNMPSYLMTDNIHDSPVCNWDVMPPLQTQGDKQRVPLSSVAT